MFARFRISLVLVLGVAMSFGWREPAPAQELKFKQEDAPLPKHALRRLGSTCFRHGSRILALAFHPQSAQLAAGGGHDAVRFWSLDSGKAGMALEDPWVYAMAFHPRGTLLVTAGAFKTIRMFHTADGKEIAKLEGHTTPVKALALDPVSNLLYSGGLNGEIIVFSLNARRQTAKFAAHADEVTALALSADGTILFSASNDGAVQARDVASGGSRLLYSIPYPGGATALALDPEDKVLYVGGNDGLIRRFDPRSGKPLQELRGHEGIITGLVLAEDGHTLISNAQDHTVRLWDVRQDQVKQILRLGPGYADALALHPKPGLIAVAGVQNSVRFFRLTGEEVLQPTGPQGPLTALAVSGDGALAAAATATGRVHVYQRANGQAVSSFTCPARGDLVLAFAPGTKTLACGAEGHVHFFDAATGQPAEQAPLDFANDKVLSLAFTPDGGTLVIGTRRHGYLWDVQKKEMRATLNSVAPVDAVAVSPDSRTVALGGGSRIALFQLESGAAMTSFPSKKVPPPAQPLVASLAFGADSKTLAVGTYDGVIRLFDALAGQEVLALQGHASAPHALAFARDGRTLASASFNGQVLLWEAFSGLTLAKYAGHAGPASAVAFAPDHRTLLSASADGSVLVWDVCGSPASLPALAEPQLVPEWEALKSSDPERAHQATWRWIHSPQEAAAYFDTHLYFLDPAKVDLLFDSLDHDDFRVRTRAYYELQKYGIWMKGRLETALQKELSSESRARILQLLDFLSVPGAPTIEQERLRVRRAQMILEQIGDARAVAVMQKLATNAAEPALQEEARLSVKRMKPS